ncbi:hypothetical protein AUP68_00459 [Ilyonectria robusta]
MGIRTIGDFTQGPSEARSCLSEPPRVERLDTLGMSSSLDSRIDWPTMGGTISIGVVTFPKDRVNLRTRKEG